MAILGKRPIKWLNGEELRNYLPLALRDMVADYKSLSSELAQSALRDIGDQLTIALRRDPRLRIDLSHPIAMIECKYDMKQHNKRFALSCEITVTMPKQKMHVFGEETEGHLAKPLKLTLSALKYDPVVPDEDIERLAAKWESESKEKTVSYKMEITKPERARARIAQEKAVA